MIRKMRRDKDLSQAKLAEAMGLGQNVTSRIEHGTRQVSLGELRAICKCLGVTLSDFVRDFESQVEAQ